MTASTDRFSIAFLLDGKGGGRDLTDDEVDSWSESDGILWLDIDQNNEGGMAWLADTKNIEPAVSTILLAGETRPRAIVEDHGLVAVLRGINMNPGAVPDDMVAVRMWIEQRRIVTSRRRVVLSVGDVREMLVADEGPASSGEFLVAMTDCLSGRIESAVENIEDVIDDLDEQMNEGDITRIRVDLGVVRRQAAAIRRHLAPQRDALDRIARSATGLLSTTEMFELREAGDQLTRHIEDLDLARENALVTQEELMNRLALEQNSRMYVLSIVAAIFLPLTFVTGLLGMNVAGLPGTVTPNGFSYSIVIMVVLGIALIGYFRWRKWL